MALDDGGRGAQRSAGGGGVGWRSAAVYGRGDSGERVDAVVLLSTPLPLLPARNSPRIISLRVVAVCKIVITNGLRPKYCIETS